MQTVYSVIRLVLAIMYPAYNSYKVMQTNTMVEYANIITYWVVFSVFTVTEQVVDKLFVNIFSYYCEFKIIFILWLVSPFTMGYSFLFSWVVQPLMVRMENKLDDFFTTIKKKKVNSNNKCNLPSFTDELNINSYTKEFEDKDILEESCDLMNSSDDYKVNEDDGKMMEETIVKAVRGRRKTLTRPSMKTTGEQVVPHVVLRGGGRRIEQKNDGI